MCKVNYPLMTVRLNAVLRVLASHLKKVNPKASITIDSTAGRDISGSRLRPDIIQVGLKGNHKSAILDVKCPFPFRENDKGSFVDRCDARNLEKYANLAQRHKGKYGSCFLGSIIVPSVGPIPKATLSALKSVGFSDREATKTLREMSIALVRANVKFNRRLSSSPV